MLDLPLGLTQRAVGQGIWIPGSLPASGAKAMRGYLRASVAVALILGAVVAVQEVSVKVRGDPIIPSSGGFVVQSNITGSAFDVATFSNDGVVIVGSSVGVSQHGGTGVNLKPLDGFIAKYDSTLTNEWVRTIDFGRTDLLNGVLVNGDGDIIAVGVTATGSGETGVDSWAYAFKYSASTGSEVWRLNFSVPDNAGTGFTSVVANGTGYLIAGSTAVSTEVSGAEWYPLTVRIDASGGVVEYSVYTDYDCTDWADISLAGSGTHYLAGSRKVVSGSNCAEGISFEGCMGKLAGTMSWHNCGSEFALTAVANVDARPIANGVKSVSGERLMATLARLDNGNVDWSQTAGAALGTQHFGPGGIVALGTAPISSSTNATNLGLPGPGYSVGEIAYDALYPPAALSIKYDSSGAVVWSTQYSPTGYGVWVGGSALDDDPRLNVAGFRVNQIGTPEPHPIILRYTSLS